jgi:hypothetical protein
MTEGETRDVIMRRGAIDETRSGLSMLCFATSPSMAGPFVASTYVAAAPRNRDAADYRVLARLAVSTGTASGPRRRRRQSVPST